MKTQLVLSIMTLALSLGLATDSFAKNGGRTKADRIRVAAEVEIDEELGQRMQAKFESRGEERRRLHVETLGFAQGDIFDVSIKIGNATFMLGSMEVDDLLESEIDFREDSWLVGLPTSIPAGSTVIVKKGNMVTNLVLQTK